VAVFAVGVRLRFCSRERRARVELKRHGLRAHNAVRMRTAARRGAQ